MFYLPGLTGSPISSTSKTGVQSGQLGFPSWRGFSQMSDLGHTDQMDLREPEQAGFYHARHLSLFSSLPCLPSHSSGSESPFSSGTEVDPPTALTWSSLLGFLPSLPGAVQDPHFPQVSEFSWECQLLTLLLLQGFSLPSSKASSPRKPFLNLAYTEIPCPHPSGSGQDP